MGEPFIENSIDFESFVELDDDNVRQLGITAMGPRLRVMRIIKAAAKDLAQGGAQHQNRLARITAKSLTSSLASTTSLSLESSPQRSPQQQQQPQQETQQQKGQQKEKRK